MIRWGMALILAASTVACPLLCESAIVVGCVGVCTEPECPADDEPLDPCQEQNHGCLCQGATAEISLKKPTLDIEVADFPFLAAYSPGLLHHHLSPSLRFCSFTLHEPLDGRSIRIARQSFLI